jgi:hypothetical protein
MVLCQRVADGNGGSAGFGGEESSNKEYDAADDVPSVTQE